MSKWKEKGTPERRRYLDLLVQQLLNWTNGLSLHHPMSNECCPDFSCCHPGLYERDSSKRVEKLRSVIQKREEERT